MAIQDSIIWCAQCTRYMRYREWFAHKHGVKFEEGWERALDFSSMTHAKVLNHYALHPELIEEGMATIFKELPIFRGKIDLVTRDKEHKICIVEIAHKSNMDRKFWTKKLRAYQSHLTLVGERIFKINPQKFRLLLVKPGRAPEEIT